MSGVCSSSLSWLNGFFFYITPISFFPRCYCGYARVTSRLPSCVMGGCGCEWVLVDEHFMHKGLLCVLFDF